MSTYLKAGDVRQPNDLYRRINEHGIKAWHWAGYYGDVITEAELRMFVYMRPSAEWLAIWKNHLPPPETIRNWPQKRVA
jgi:hypothetical protein